MRILESSTYHVIHKPTIKLRLKWLYLIFFEQRIMVTCVLFRKRFADFNVFLFFIFLLYVYHNNTHDNVYYIVTISYGTIVKKTNLLLSCHWPFSMPPENIRKSLVQRKFRGMNWGNSYSFQLEECVL